VGKYGTNLEGFGAFEGGVNADKGAPLVSTSSDGETSLLFGPAALREIQAGVANGDFAIPPDSAGDTITEENPLPYWTFTDVDSAGAITAAIVADSTAASGNVVRFSVGTITGAKTVILSRYIAIPSSRDRAFAVFPEAYVGSNTGDTNITTSLRWSWYTSNFTVTGTGGTTPVSDSGSTTLRPASATTLAAPSDASYIYVEVLVKTIGSLASNKRVDLFEVRLSQGGQVAVIAEKATPQTYKPLTISQDGGNPTFDYDTAGVANFTGNVDINGYSKLDGSTISQVEVIASASNTSLGAAGTFVALERTSGYLEVSFTPQFVGQRWLFLFTGYSSLNTSTRQYSLIRADVRTSADVAITSPWAYTRAEGITTSGVGATVAISKVWVADRTTGCKFKLYGTAQTTSSLIISVSYVALTAYPIG